MADKLIDPRLSLPLVDGYKYEDTGTARDETASPVDITIALPSALGLQPPSTATVVEQIFRKGPDGRTVVDIVIEVEDVAGASEYEVRVATA